MTTVAEISCWMDRVAPLALSESWDNTGLLLGCPEDSVERIQTCLTLTRETVDEAIAKQANMVISHHPLPFKPLARITTLTTPGKLLWKLASHRISIYAPHTAWDSAELGINALLARILGLADCRPLIPSEDERLQGLGAGRIGSLPKPESLGDIVSRLQTAIPTARPRAVDCARPIQRIAIVCGSGGSLLPEAIRQDCELFLTGEATFHTCLEAQAADMSLLMIGHYSSERFAMEHLASQISQGFPNLNAWASFLERDPVQAIV